jgi:integrase
MATIQKYKTKTGENRFRVKWRDEDKFKSKSFDRYTKAKDYLTELENALREGSYVAPNKTILKDFLDTWFSNYKKGLAIKTVIGYENCINHIKNQLGNNELQKLSAADIDAAYKNLSVKLSGKTLQYIHMVLNLSLKAAVKKRLIRSNPCEVVDRPTKKKYESNFIRPEDIQKYLDVFKGSWIYTGVLLGLFCGLRRGEILALEWKDVDLINGLITVDKSAGRHKKEFYEKGTKSERRRTVHLPVALVDKLKDIKEEQEKRKEEFTGIYKESNFVLVEENGTRPDPSLISRHFNRKIKSSKLPHVRFHDLRHTAVSLMILNGTDIKTVSDIAGHSSITMTADIYAHVIEESKKKAADGLNKYLE